MKRLLVVLFGIVWPAHAWAAPPTAEQELELRSTQLQGEIFATAAGDNVGAEADNYRTEARVACQHLEDSLRAFDTDPLHRAWLASCWGSVKFWSGDKSGGCVSWTQARSLALTSSHPRSASQLTSVNVNLERCPTS